MTADAVSPELHGPLLALHRHAEGLLASHRRIEATGNLAVGSIELLEGTFAAKRRSVAAQSQADERNLALIGHIETTVDRTQRMVYGDYELPQMLTSPTATSDPKRDPKAMLSLLTYNRQIHNRYLLLRPKSLPATTEKG